jgi:hypothetical protein
MKRNKAITEIYTPIVVRAIKETVTDIGGRSHQELLELNYAVKHGILAKGKGGPYPILKTVYARPGFDFAADRARLVAQMQFLGKLDEMRLGHSTIFSRATFQSA